MQLSRFTPSALISRVKGRLALKEYSDWAAASNACGQGYDNDALSDFRVQRALLWGGAPQPGLLELMIAGFEGRAPCVVDFGGSAGERAATARAVKSDTRYIVVETPSLAARAEGHFDAEFTTQIPEACDLFLSSRTLSYVEDPSAVLRQAFSITAHAVVLARNIFHQRVSYWVHDTHMFDHGVGPIPAGFPNRQLRYPCQTLVENDLCLMARDAGFDLVYRGLDQQRFWLSSTGAYGADLVFTRR